MTRVIIRTPEQKVAHARRRRELANERREAGLCVNCGRARGEGSEHVQCERCLRRRSVVQSREYRERDRKGLCVECGKHPHVPGGKKCSGCAVKARKCRRSTEAKNRAAGVCVDCRRCRAVQSGRCQGCVGKRKGRNSGHVRKLRRKRERDGLCIECGGEWISDKYTRCDDCREIQAQKARDRANERITKGLCRQCGKRPPCDDSTSCKACRARRRGRDRSV